jgi:hypothetical protein
MMRTLSSGQPEELLLGGRGMGRRDPSTPHRLHFVELMLLTG